MRKSILFACLFGASVIAVFSCTKDSTIQTNNIDTVDIQKVRQDIKNALQQIQTAQGVDMNVQTRMAAQFIVLPAGSNNALVQAIQDAGEGGIVYLRSGLHTESASIVISKRIILIGENGAVLKIKSTVGLPDANGVVPINPAVHVLNAQQTAIQNVEIQPVDNDGGTAVLFENSPLSAAMFCTIKQHQFSLVVEKSNQMCFIGNKITGSTLWQTTPRVLFAGILVMNGKSAWISDNEVATSLQGIFMGDEYGSTVQNNVHNCFIGLNLCDVIPNTVRLPSGQLTGTPIPTSRWKVRNNQSNNNLNTAYVVIGGANNNVLESNTSTGNGVLDYELAGDTRRLGVLQLSSFSNRLTAAAAQKVKNCGSNNTIIGGILIDNAVSPCN